MPGSMVTAPLRPVAFIRPTNVGIYTGKSSPQNARSALEVRADQLERRAIGTQHRDLDLPQIRCSVINARTVPLNSESKVWLRLSASVPKQTLPLEESKFN